MDANSQLHLEISPNAKEVARALLKIGAVELRPSQPFTWTSGWKSPIYVDIRLGLGPIETRSLLNNYLYAYCRKNKLLHNDYIIAGVMSAGALYGINLADSAHLPFVFVRPEPKKHGAGKQIDGMKELEIRERKFVVIEDLLSTGKSSARVVQAIESAGGIVVAVVAFFSYGFKEVLSIFGAEESPNRILTKPCTFGSLTNYSVLIDVAIEENYVKSSDKEMLGSFIIDPANWRH